MKTTFTCSESQKCSDSPHLYRCNSWGRRGCSWGCPPCTLCVWAWTPRYSGVGIPADWTFWERLDAQSQCPSGMWILELRVSDWNKTQVNLYRQAGLPQICLSIHKSCDSTSHKKRERRRFLIYK